MSRNYQEDQDNEVEALESIYCGEMEVLEKTPFHKFLIHITTEEFDKEQLDGGLACKLLFTYTPKYPDDCPLVELNEAINFSDNYEKQLLTHIDNVIKENLGMEMIFSLVSAAQEWLNERWDEHKKAVEDERIRKLLEAEMEEQKKFEGTRVTVQSFMKWKTEFLGMNSKSEISVDNRKLTGKELFLKDNTLNESDIKFLLEAGENIESVKIDESLFQDIGDIDYGDVDDDDDDDEDDEDWLPDGNHN